MSNTKTSTIGVTGRVNRAMGQAIRPYRKAIGIMSILLLGSFAGLGYNFFGDKETKDLAVEGINIGKDNAEKITLSNTEILELNKTLGESNKLITELSTDLDATKDSLTEMTSVTHGMQTELKKAKNSANYSASQVKALNNKLQQAQKQENDLKLEVARINTQIGRTEGTKNNAIQGVIKKAGSNVSSGKINFEKLPTNDVYYIYATKHEITYRGNQVVMEEKSRGGLYRGTAFLTNDGRLVTARHNIQPYRYYNHMADGEGKRQMFLLNLIENNGGRIITTFKAINKQNDIFTFNNNSVVVDDSDDESVPFGRNAYINYEGNDGFQFYDGAGNDKAITLHKINSSNSSDWAYINMGGSKSGKLVYDRNLSKNLEWGTRLYPIGFTFGESLQPQDGSSLKPLLSETMVAQNGLTNGVINTSVVGFGTGNSGGPVFLKNGDGFVVVGIVSAGRGSAIGVLTPISNMR